MRKNPLTMLGQIERCWLFTYQTPASTASQWLPAPLELVTRDGLAFWNVVVCRIEAMRPWPLPPLGVGYWHVAYRLYARFRPHEEEPVEGLYFLRSDCDNRLLAAAGRALTDFNFHVAGVRVTDEAASTRIEVASAEAPATVVVNRGAPTELPAHSAFGSLDEAARFLKYHPAGLSVDGAGGVDMVRIVRDEAAWRSRLVRVEREDWSYLREKETRPEVCFEVEPITYRWNRGQRYGVDTGGRS